VDELKQTRRGFLRKMTALSLAGAAGVMGYATLYEPDFYELTETDIFIPNLPGRFEGFRLAQISDVHHSRLVSQTEVRRVVALANAARPDLIALTGDYTTAYRRYIEPCAEALGDLSAPEGVWAVLGNHDHNTDAALTVRALNKRKITILDNANTTLRRGPDALQLAGLDDWTWNAHDWQRTLRGLDLTRPSVLLSHQPRTLDWAETEGFSLILSGHTHGGQIRLPLVGEPARLSKDLRYLRGHYQRGATQLYVSRGTGVIGLPLRLGVRPEIAVLRLRRQT
jgi:hypothetical protein